jgi:hypothetical protein
MIDEVGRRTQLGGSGEGSEISKESNKGSFDPSGFSVFCLPATDEADEIGARLFIDPGIPNMVSEYGAISKPHDAYDPFFGEPRTAFFDPTAGTFANGPSMGNGRWYPTGTVLADGSVMVISGLGSTGPTNTSVQVYKAATN